MGYRVPPPDTVSLVRWPDGFGTRFLVFCDVEEEFDWRRPLDRAARSTRAMVAFPDGHRRFAERGVGLACMVDHPVATDPAAVAILARAIEDGHSSIGAQLHPWVNPPDQEAVTPANSYAGNLSPTLEAAKIDALSDAIAAAFGARPIAFRAGRYGIGPATLCLLAARGYRIDASVRARFDYRADGGPAFAAIGNAAFRRDGLVELPFGTVFTGLLRRAGAALYPAAARLPRGAGVLARAGLLNRVPLTPEGVPVAEALAAVDAAIDDGERLLCFSFHSPSLAPGNTPYVRDRADLATFNAWWDAVLTRLERRGVKPATLGEVADAAAASVPFPA